MYAQVRQAAADAAARRSETGLATGAQICDALRAVQQAQDILDGVQADLMARLEDTAGYENEGASTVVGWATRELRLTRPQVRQRLKAGRTLRVLTDAEDALAEGKIRLDHVHELTGGITKLGTDLMTEASPIWMPVALKSDPKQLRQTIEHLDAVVHPDKLNDDYAKGMDKRDVKLARCGDGWHLSGFLDQLVGTKLATFLKGVAKPEHDGDDRAPSDRRVDALGRLLDEAGAVAGDDLPPDSESTADSEDAADDEVTSEGPGKQSQATQQQPPAARRRPRHQILVLADLDALLHLPGAEPATLAAFGPIGTDLLGYLTCTSDLTGLLRDGYSGGATQQAHILNVGRTSRLATTAQKHAIRARQEGVCANPGCGLTHLEFHHVAWWHRDHGATDLDNLIGLCSRCHHLVHQQKLNVEPDGSGGFTFRRRSGRPIDDHSRETKQRIREALAHLRRVAADTGPLRPGKPAPGRRADLRRQTRRRYQVRSAAEDHVIEYHGGHPPSRS